MSRDLFINKPCNHLKYDDAVWSVLTTKMKGALAGSKIHEIFDDMSGRLVIKSQESDYMYHWTGP